MSMRDFARTELAVITRAWATLRSQGGEVGMRVVGVAGRSGVEGVGGGRGMSILPHRFNPGVGLSQVASPQKKPKRKPPTIQRKSVCGLWFVRRLTVVMDGAFMVERSETLLERLRGQGF